MTVLPAAPETTRSRRLFCAKPPLFFHYVADMGSIMPNRHLLLLLALVLAFIVPPALAAPSPQSADSLPASLAGQEPIDVIAPPAPPFALRSGDTLRETLKRWADAAGYQLIWSIDKDYPVDVSMTFPQGTSFREALSTLLKAYWDKRYAITGSLYSNHVLVITGRQG